MRYGRTFNTIEEAIKTWRAEQDAGLSRSGILCYCTCHIEKKPKNQHRSRCVILVPKEVYEKYHKKGDEPGMLRVIYSTHTERKKAFKNFGVESDLCSHKFDIDTLLAKHFGKKIRLGKNLRVR